MSGAPAVRSYRGVLPTLGARVYVDPQASVIGKVTLGADASVWPMAVLRGDVNTIRLGERTNVQDGSVLHVTHDGPFSPGGLPLVIGDDVTIGHHVVLHGCTLGSRILVGMGAVVLDGAVVEDEVIVGAGTVVPPGRRLPTRTLWIGNPARRLRELSARELEQFTYLSRHYVRIKDDYRSALTPGS
jgi:carbonic anhydrase/acetyltransferase-like protein (isoleucine patch superfamily)